MELAYPDLVVEDRQVMEREGLTVALEWMGRANTDGDLLVWLPDDGVLITGGDPVRTFAWLSFYLTPSLRSVWAALGHPVAEGS